MSYACSTLEATIAQQTTVESVNEAMQPLRALIEQLRSGEIEVRRRSDGTEVAISGTLEGAVTDALIPRERRRHAVGRARSPAHVWAIYAHATSASHAHVSAARIFTTQRHHDDTTTPYRLRLTRDHVRPASIRLALGIMAGMLLGADVKRAFAAEPIPRNVRSADGDTTSAGR